MNQLDIIKDFLIKHIIPDSDQIDLNYEDTLIESGMIDSLGIVKVVTFLEDEFKIEINDEDILPENFESIKAISLFVDMKRNTRS